MNSNDIRQQFIDFFKDRGHTFVPSAPVVPFDDPTLLFTNAGMNQFKDVFLGTGTREYTRAANSQKCIRAGGKHNDLDDVGHDTYHHTFFEMLGNWSFGDYFKAEAIEWAWELLTRAWGLPKQRLHATVFEGDAAESLEPDREAAELWRKVTDIDPNHIHRGSKKDNFWEMGDTGPCGPCSEIHIDLTPDCSGAALVNAGDPRVIEIWNLVFIQFNRDSSGSLTPLPASHVDTGMGFERIAAVLQGHRSNYDTDIFTPIFAAIRQATGAPEYTGLLENGTGGRRQIEDPAQRRRVMQDVAYRVIADHLRCLTFALSDGAMLGNEGRGYVLRRILRRAVRYGRQYFDVHEPFLHEVVSAVVTRMAPAFPELQHKPQQVADTIREEEESFGKTYERGVKLFEEAAEWAETHGRGRISGEAAFKLHDTYGFAVDLTMLMAEERHLKVDVGEYERLMDEARRRARGGKGAQAGGVELLDAQQLAQAGPCDDSPKYDEALRCDAVITACAEGPKSAVAFTTDRTCFYAEQGGQVADVGTARTATATIQVTDVQRRGDRVVHYGRLQDGRVTAGQECTLEVSSARWSTMKNHTATHILNWALREVLGGHVDQKGSLVDPDKTRFDFSHPRPLTSEQLKRIEDQVNACIAANAEVYTREVAESEARKLVTLRAVFGEKYPEIVRVVSIGKEYNEMIRDPGNPEWMNYSVEFCGGTHVKRTAASELFRVLEETAVAKGIRRISGVTGSRAKACDVTARELSAALQELGGLTDADLQAGLGDFSQRLTESACGSLARLRLNEALAALQARVKKQTKARARAEGEDVRAAALELLASATEVGSARLVVGQVPWAPADRIRETIDLLRDRAGSAGICLGCEDGSKVLLVASLTDDLVGRGIRAGDLIKEVAPLVGGGGGGKPQLAQAGGKNPAGLSAALQRARGWLEQHLTSR